MDKLISLLNQEINGKRIELFRIVFAIALLWECFYLYSIDFIEVFLHGPELLFPFPFFEDVPLLSPIFCNIILGVITVAALAILLGVFTRVAFILYGLGFGYFFLLEKALYNNHLYMILLVCFLGAMLPLGQSKSILPRKQKLYHYWNLLTLQLMICLVYFYGGIAKLNPDWLYRQEPAREMLKDKSIQNGIEWMTSEPLVNFIAYGGLLFDLLVPFALLWPVTTLWGKRIRYTGIIAAVLFNVNNAWMFDDINIFPYLMLGSLVLFLPAAPLNKTVLPLSRWDKKKVVVLGLFFLIQAILPYRHLMYSGRTEWTMYGQYFSWRMKIQNRSIDKMEFKVLDPDKKIIYPVNIATYALTDDQRKLLARDPEAVIRFANYLKGQVKKNSIKNPWVTANILVSLNGLPAKQMFDSNQNLLEIEKDDYLPYIQPSPTD